MPHHARPTNRHPLATAHLRAGRASPQRFQRTVLACAIGYACATGLAAVTVPDSALAEDSPAAQTQRQAYAIPAGPLEAALNRFGREAGVLLSFPTEMTAGRQSPGLRGNYAVQEGLSRLLQDTGLSAVAQANGSYTLVAVARREGDGNAVTTLPSVTVSAGRETNLDVDEGFKADFQTSATKTPLSIRETPQSISVITKDSIEARFSQDTASALELAAGVSKAAGNPGPFAGSGSASGSTGEQFLIRGVMVNNSNDVREDGFSFPGAVTTESDVALYERIEAVKGPASVLYGRGSAGGFINRVRKKPLATPQVGAEFTTGSFDLYRGEVDATGPITDSGAVRGRFIAAYQQDDAFVDGVESERFVIAPVLRSTLPARPTY